MPPRLAVITWGHAAYYCRQPAAEAIVPGQRVEGSRKGSLFSKSWRASASYREMVA